MLFCLAVLIQPLCANPQAPDKLDPIEKLKQIIDFPQNDRNAAPYYREMVKWIEKNGISKTDLKIKAIQVPQMEKIVQCGVYAPRLPRPFVVKDALR